MNNEKITMNKRIIILALSLFIIPFAWAVIDWKVPNNKMIFGDGAATIDKVFEANVGDGAANPKITIPFATKDFLMSDALTVQGDGTFEGDGTFGGNGIFGGNSLTVGDSAASNKTLTFDIGGSNPFFKWDNALGKIVLSNDGTIFSPISTEAAEIKDAALLNNAGLLVTASANAMTIALKQSDGSTDATSLSSVKIVFRDSSNTSGALNIRSVESSLSLIISDGATLGTTNAVNAKIYIYAIDNSGTVELAIGNIKIDGTESLVNTTILDTSSDSRGVLYSTVARSNIPIRVIGFFESSQATAGIWASNPSLVGVGNHLIDITRNVNITDKAHDCWFEIANNGTATIQYDDGCLTSATRTSAGDVDVTFKNIVSGKATCVCMILFGGYACSSIGNQITLPVHSFRSDKTTDGASVDHNFSAYCSWR